MLRRRCRTCRRPAGERRRVEPSSDRLRPSENWDCDLRIADEIQGWFVMSPTPAMSSTNARPRADGPTGKRHARQLPTAEDLLEVIAEPQKGPRKGS
jgi:hypothetical protein